MDVSSAPAPAVPSSTSAAPGVGVSVSSAPRMPVSLSPAGAVPEAWVAIPAASGEAILVLTSTADLVAVADTVGDATLALAASSETEALGGFLESSGDAQLSLTASADLVAVADSTGDATLVLAASSVSEGTLKAAPMGMLKSGGQSPVIGESVWTTLTGFTADPAYPDTALTGGNTLVSHGPGAVTVTAAVDWSGGTGDKDIRVLVNGTAVWTKGVSNFGSATQSGSFAQQIAAGDQVTLQAWCSAVEARRSIAATNTSLHFTIT